jgi:hypothetical protein
MFGSRRNGLFFLNHPATLAEPARVTAARALGYLYRRIQRLYRRRQRITRPELVTLCGALGHADHALEALAHQARTGWRVQELFRFRRN